MIDVVIVPILSFSVRSIEYFLKSTPGAGVQMPDKFLDSVNFHFFFFRVATQ